MIKYPKTPRLQAVLREDHHDWRHYNAVISEKLDGANAGISFDGDELQLQCRGHILQGGWKEHQFDLFKQQANVLRDQLLDALGNRYLLFGEWMYAKHRVFYDNLPGYFIEYDLYDKDNDLFVSTPVREQLLADLPIPSAPVLHRAKFGKVNNFAQYIRPSSFSTTELMEGVYIKVEDDKQVVARIKLPRPEFEKIETDDRNWYVRPIVPNQLRVV
jgi:hypothetical protein